MAESVIGLYKTEMIRGRKEWKDLEEVELATLSSASWFNNERLMGPLGYVPPAEYEEQFHRTTATCFAASALN